MKISVTIEIRRPGWMKSVWVRRSRPLVLLLALVFAGPVLASDRFSDVPTDSVHHNDINLIAVDGITRGCNAEGTLYCPTQFVTREQMGSFLARAAGLGDHPDIARAYTAVFADSASYATDAEGLDGLDSTAFLRSSTYGLSKVTTGGAGGNQVGTDTLACHGGDMLLSGGIDHLDSGTWLNESRPGPAGNNWVATWENNSTVDTVTLIVYCSDQ